VRFEFSNKKGRFKMMRLNVGLSKKVSDNQFGSKGGNIWLEVEIDASLLGDSSKLQEQIHQLFCLVRKALDEELGIQSNSAQEANEPRKQCSFANNGLIKPNSNVPPRLASEKQLSLIQGLIRRGKIPFQPLLDERKVGSFNELTVSQASWLIGELKAKIG